MRKLIVGGNFDRKEGRPSSIINKMADALGWVSLNGGTLDTIQNFDFSDVDALIWMPNIDNAEDKIIPNIKSQNQKLLLISSKRVVEKSYSEFDVISRLLKTRSNLGIMIQKQGDVFGFKLLDPLGNQYCETSDISELAIAINKRVDEIKLMTRIGSLSLGDKVDVNIDPAFIEIVKSLGDDFSRYVNAVNPERFLGNAAARDTDRITRCCHGFPGVRDGDKLYISRRNVDKQNMTADDFVAVIPEEDKVKYYGDIKPSVDSPIQIRLFNHFKNVNYMVHGHVYVEGAPVTHSRIPCGHVEEFNEIVALYPDESTTDFSVNLKGHGCLMLASDTSFFDNVQLQARPFPEI